MKKSKQSFILILALVFCLTSAIGTSLIMRDFGKVQVTNISTKTKIGTLTGYLFTPENASAEQKLPAIVVSHGATANAGFVDSWYVELARRGYIVFTPNLYGHGESSIVDSSYAGTISYDSNGLYDAVEYLSTLDIVDQDKIAVTGHSLGGGSSIMTAAHYTKLERDALANGATVEEAHALNKVAACLTVGYPLTVDLEIEGFESTETFDGMLCDLGVILGKYDDFQSWMNKDILINKHGADWFETQVGLPAPSGGIVEGEFYKNSENEYRFAMWNPGEIHNQNLISFTTTGALLDFFEETIGAPNPITNSSQIWMVKKLLGDLGIVGIFMFLIPCAYYLLKIPAFSSLIGKAQPCSPLTDKREKRKFYGSAIAGALINTVLILPLVLIGSFLPPTLIWPQIATSGFAFWGVMGGLITLLTIRIGTGKKLKYNSEALGTKITKRIFSKPCFLLPWSLDVHICWYLQLNISSTLAFVFGLIQYVHLKWGKCCKQYGIFHYFPFSKLQTPLLPSAHIFPIGAMVNALPILQHFA